jgi:hypothetical protein
MTTHFALWHCMPGSCGEGYEGGAASGHGEGRCKRYHPPCLATSHRELGGGKAKEGAMPNPVLTAKRQWSGLGGGVVSCCA